MPVRTKPERELTPMEARAEAAQRELARREYEYFARRFFRILDKGNRVVPLQLRPCQLRVGASEYWQIKKRGRARSYVLKGRQGGITTDQQSRAFHAIWAGREGIRCRTIADTKDRADEIFLIARRGLRHFPRRMLPPIRPTKTKEIDFYTKDCRYSVGTAGVPEKTAIGVTLTRAHCSEFAHWPEPLPALAALEPALEAPGTVITLETTASGFGSEGYTAWHTADELGYERIFIPWWECDPETYREELEAPDELGSYTGEEQALVERHGLTPEQIKWRRRKIRGPGARNEFLRQYPEDDESCWIAAGGMYYDAAMLRILVQRAPKPIAEHMGGERLVYSRLLPGEIAVGGADTAEGVGQDASTASFRALPSWRLLETFESRSITPSNFAAYLARRGRKMGDAFLVVEKNMHGITVLRDLRDKWGYPISSLYHREPLDRQAPEATERIGWATTEESKPLLLAAGAELFDAAAKGLVTPPPEAVAKQALAVRRNKSGKYDLNGKDLLVAETLAWVGRSAPMPSEGMFEAMRQRIAGRVSTAPKSGA